LKNILARTITGALLVAILVSAIVVDRFAFLAVFTAITCFAMHEFYKIFKYDQCSPQVIPGIITGALLFLSSFIKAAGYIDNSIFLMFILCLLFIFIYELFREKKAPFINIAVTLLGIIYIAAPFSLLNFIGFRENIYIFHYQIILGIFILIWSYDTGAYLVGMNFGKHKLFPRVSPKKTWEGAIGGWIVSMAIAWILFITFDTLRLTDWFIVASIIAIFGSMGDFIESMLKRSYDLKDSGHILPGHGGILDRFDTIFVALPVIFIYLYFV